MRYMGGKERIAKHIAAIINAQPQQRYFEPFLGGASIASRVVKPERLLTDAHPALITMWQHAQAGGEFPEVVTEDGYRAAKDLPDSDPLKAFIGFGCSFGGKYFGGYAKGSSARNYALTARRSLSRKVKGLAGAEIACVAYTSVNPSALGGWVTYCDPPYANTTGYSGVGVFNSEAFWGWAMTAASAGGNVLVSEYTCPVPHEVLWSKSKPTALRHGKHKPATEYLFRVLPG